MVYGTHKDVCIWPCLLWTNMAEKWNFLTTFSETLQCLNKKKKKKTELITMLQVFGQTQYPFKAFLSSL
jgi:hypothetical protein